MRLGNFSIICTTLLGTPIVAWCEGGPARGPLEPPPFGANGRWVAGFDSGGATNLHQSHRPLDPKLGPLTPLELRDRLDAALQRKPFGQQAVAALARFHALQGLLPFSGLPQVPLLAPDPPGDLIEGLRDTVLDPADKNSDEDKLLKQLEAAANRARRDATKSNGSTTRGPVNVSVEGTARELLDRAARWGDESGTPWFESAFQGAGERLGPWLERAGEWVSDLELPRVRIRLPGSGDDPVAWLPAPALPDSGQIRGGMMVLLAAAIGNSVLALVRFRRGATTSGDQPPVLRLAAISPDDVRSRTDLVRAFDVLALRRLGLDVRSWTHRRVAGALAAHTLYASTAADELAELYEVARYAPARVPFTSEHLQRARDSLRQLESS